ncbi:uncharacterized protein K02A2.6-like [Sitophilus oryzae]|uniref:Uncharacterized protein K02A2.6-like n=1 Tax=Sitophilus oryzae TaxID=7048 RepID=A0A6J2YCT7_SITOR|nr:uncharacterized protein K02A2.6-like [Sitophilus oryzae]
MGPLPNQDQILVVIDYYSRYQDIQFLKSTTSAIIIRCLDKLFSRFGIPKSIRADNGRQFVSQEFKDYCDQNNIKLIHTPPYWPQANGEVENMNRSILKRLQICHNNKQDYKAEIQKFIMMYNVTPHGTTDKSPSELLFQRRIRDKIPSIVDIMGNTSMRKHKMQIWRIRKKGKRREDESRGAKQDYIRTGDKVVIQNIIRPHKLTSRFNSVEYDVIERNGNELILFGDGKTIRRHVAHVKKIVAPNPTEMVPAGNQETVPSQEASVPTASTSVATPVPSDSRELDPPGRITMRLKRKDGMWQPAGGTGNNAEPVM